MLIKGAHVVVSVILKDTERICSQFIDGLSRYERFVQTKICHSTGFLLLREWNDLH